MIERFSKPVGFHGEGQCGSTGCASSMLAGDFLTLDEDAAARAHLHVGEVAAASLPGREGGLVVVVVRGFALIGADGALERLPEA